MFKLLAFARPLIAGLIPGGGLASLASSAVSLVTALVKFFSTPFGRWVGLVLIGAALYVAGDLRRAALDRETYRSEWARALARAEAARSLRDAAIRREVAAEAERRIAEIRRESDDLQAKVADYEKSLSGSDAARCRLTADDARRLRELFSGPGAAAR